MRRPLEEAGLGLWLLLGLGAACAKPPPDAEPDDVQRSHRDVVAAQVDEPASEAEAASAGRAYSVTRTLRDYADDGGYTGKTTEAWACDADKTCANWGETEVEFADGRRLGTGWRREYDAAGRVTHSRETVSENGAQISQAETQYTAQTVTEVRADGTSRTLTLPGDFRDCASRCRELVRTGNAEPDHCDVLYPEGLLRFRLTVTPLEHPIFGMVYDQRTQKPGEPDDRQRIMDANCQQLEAHVSGSHSKLLTEERTGTPNVPKYGP